MSRVDKILRLQEAMKACKEVYAVLIRCDGEESISCIWETREAAEIERDAHNNIRGNKAGYYGKARVMPMKIRTEAMARDFYLDAIEASKK